MHNERSQNAYEVCISDFCKKDLTESEWVIVGGKMLYPQNSGTILKNLFIILLNKRGDEAHEN